ncbi:MAG: C25 family cysteine peptidase [Chloroflexota bacterium]
MTYTGDVGNNDQYTGTITPGVGLYEFTAYCSDGTSYWQTGGNGKLVVDAASGSCNGASQNNNDLYWNGLFHDSFSTSYRSPTGPVTTASTVTLTFRTCMDDVNAVPTIRIWDDRTNTSTTPAMTFDGHGSDATLGGVTYWTYDLAVGADPTIYYYVFQATDGSATAYYRDDDPKFYGGGYGVAEGNQTTAYDNSYQLTVYDPAFDVPEWMQRGVVYQIFPDRFRDGDPTNNPAAGRFFYNEAGGTIVRSNTSAWNTTVCDPRDAGGCLGEYSNNFYGGDLAGITEKINAGYFDQLGVSVIYLNPIFLSPSNHKYDTANYLVIDGDFGGDDAAESLALFGDMIAAANAHNIKIILDGVFNHTSSDSMYFDRYGRYDSSGSINDIDGGTDDDTGACEAGASPFYSWFYFPAGSNPGKDQPGDVTVYCPNGGGDANQTYEAWYGYSSLPKLQANISAVRTLIWETVDNSSVGKYWTDQGASGWRFDVGADVDPGLTNDPTNDYWEGFRTAVRAVDPETVTLGEEWGDASAWLLGNEWDSVMNYRYRSAVMSWLFTACDGGDDGCSGGTSFEDNDSNSSSSSGAISAITPSQFNARLLSIQEDYPPMAWKAMMNLEGSHDTNRIRFLLTKINGNDDAQAVQRMKEMWLFAFTYAGAPTLYYGDEVGLSQDGVWDGSRWQDDPYNRAPFPWDDTTGDFTADTTLQDFARMMASIRHSYRALQDGDVQHGIVIDDANKLYGFARTNGSQTALIVLNRDEDPHLVTISGLNAAPYSLANGTDLVDPISGDTYTVAGGAVTDVWVDAVSGVVLLEQDQIETPAEPGSATFSFNGSDVTLAWNLVSLDTGSGREVPTLYTIHRSATYPFTPDAGNQIDEVAPPAYGVAQSRMTYTDPGASGTDAYAVCAQNAGGQAGCVTLASQCSANTNLFRSVGSGPWADDASWEVSTDGGGSWGAASCWPTASNGTLTIQSGHTLTVGSNFSVDQLTVNTGGQLTVDSGATLTIANGSGNDVTVSAGAGLTVNGTINNSNSSGVIVANGAGTTFVVNGTVINSGTITTTAATATYNSGGTYQHNYTTTGGTIPTATWNSNSTVLVSGYTTYGGTPAGYGQAFGNLTWNCTSQSGSVNFGGNLTNLQGSLTVLSTGSGVLRVVGNSTPFTLNVGGNISVSGGNFVLVSGTSNATINVAGNTSVSGGTFDLGSSSGAPTLNISGNFTQTGGTLTRSGSGNRTINLAGNWSYSAGTFTNTGITVNMNGSTAQTIGGSAATTFNNLTINNAAGVSLSGVDATVNGTLDLGANKLATGANKVILVSASGPTRTSGWVNGNLQKPVAVGNTSVTFQVGDATDYAPITVNFTGASAGTLTGSTTDGQHPRYMDTDISDVNYINRYWTLTPDGGLTFTSYNATFTFNNPGDFVGSPATGSLVLQKYSGSTWTNPPGGPSSDSTTVTGTGFTSFSDFMAGNGGTPLPVTLSYFQATRIGTEVLFDWSTATETGNLGFNLYGLDENGQRVLLNQELIPSQDVDSLARLDYSLQLETPFDTFYVQDVDITGRGDWHGPYQVGQTYGARADSSRIDWAAVHAERQAASKDLRLELSALPEELSLNLKVRQTGLYRVTYEMLRAAGLDLEGLPAANLLLTNRGRQVPLYVGGPDPLGAGSFLEFHGEALDTLYTDANIYTLRVSSTPVGSLLVEDTNFNRHPVENDLYYTETLVVNNQREFANYAPGADAWYDTSMLTYTSAKSWEFHFQVDGLADPTQKTDLDLVVWGVTDWPQSPDHHLLVNVNGLQVATDTFNGLSERTLHIQLPAGLLREGDNVLTLTLPGDTGVGWDMVNLDQFTITYPRLMQAREGRLAFTAAGQSFTVTNLPAGEVVVYRINAKGTMTRMDLVRTRAAGDGTFTATFNGAQRPTQYIVSTLGSMYTPEFEAPYVQADLDQPAQYLVIAHPDFINGIQPLVQAREAQGLTVRVVNVNDLYHRYTYGIFDPQAIKQYIAYAAENLGTEYVLLVGGDTYDYRNYLGIGSVSFIPSLYVATGPTVRFVPVDPLYADVDNDNLPDLAIGRFPARTAAELNLLVSKTLAYAGKDYARTAVFASDLSENGLSFKNINEDMAAQLPGWSVENLHLDDLNVTSARERLVAAMNRGTALVTFTGHSGPQEWTFSNLFDMGDAAALTNHGRPFVAVQWGCWNSYYVDPQHNYLVQSFLFSGDQGAAAVLGASTLSNSTSEMLLGKLLTPKLAVPGMTLGQALLQAKTELAQTHPELLDVLLGWSLMGDPALVVTP